MCAASKAPRESQVLDDGGGIEGRSMIAVDTSTWIAYLKGEEASDTQMLD